MPDIQGEAARRFMSADWLTDANEADRRAVFAVLNEAPAPAGTRLLEQGKANSRLVFLIAGEATVDRVRSDGRTEAIATLQAPTVFGTTSFFRPEKTPSFNVRALAGVQTLTLDRDDYGRLRRDNPRAAEALAVDALRTLADRFEELDRLFSEYIVKHPDERPKTTEWSGFRARLFEEHGV